MNKLFIPLFLTACYLFLPTWSFAQDGALKGKILDKTNGEPIPFANIVAERGGKLAGGTTTDFDGYYTIKPLSPGTYDMKVTYVGYKSILISGVIVKSDKITFQDIKMSSTVEELGVVEIWEYEVPLIEKDGGPSGETVTREDIASMPTRSAIGIAATVGGVFQRNEGGALNIRGSRSEALDIYIDGVKVRGSSGIPQSAIEQVTVITGGLPAKYGDVTGGIINITTRGPSSKYYGGLEVLTSGFYIKDKNIGFDPYGYNLLGFNLSGPLLMMWDKRDSTKKPLLGFFLSGELTSIKDLFPSAIGMWKIKDDVLDSLKKDPIRQSGTGTGSFPNTDFVTIDDLEQVKIKQNVGRKGFNLSGKVDVRTGPDINLTFGGNMAYSNRRIYSYSNSLFNYENNEQRIESTWRVYGKFTQKFGSGEIDEEKSASAIKNAFYTLQVDYTKFHQTRQDSKHKDNFFDYGYIGKFTTYKINTYINDVDSATGLSGMIHNNWQDTLYFFERDTLERNSVAANFTDQYYGLYDETVGNYENYIQVQDDPGGLLNSQRPGNIYNTWTGFGRVFNTYSFRNNTQFRIIASGSADIKNHAISVGFEYEQRNDRFKDVVPAGLWGLMRQLSNNHILQLDFSNPYPVYVPDANGNQVFVDTVNYDRLYDGASQFLFDYNLRKKWGLDPAGIDWIDLNALPPETFSLDMFSADELLAGGTGAGALRGFVNYYGYDYTGKKLKGTPTLDDFFTQTKTVEGYTGLTIFDRPIGAYEPIYVAGYIQDKFAFKDLIFNIGLRVDRFDANQKVLIDPYLLFPAITAGEVKGGEDRAKLTDNIPGNIGDDYVVYVDNIDDPDKIVGFRNGSTWYNEEGAEVPNADPLLTGAGIQPYLLDPNIKRAENISSKAFEDYEPQVTFMPRIAFSFPISDEALFFAHYDVLSQRPSTNFASPIERLDPTHYLFIQNRNIVINNPNLKPEKTIDYELGFQQKLNNTSSLKISAFYREMRDMIQITRVVEAYPNTYTTWGNLDFGTVKGMTVTYDLRRTGNVRMRASYTLQFAEGTGSAASQALGIIASGQPNLKTVNALDFDQRHTIITTVDYRFGKGKDYNGPIWKGKQILANAGANIVFLGGSGTPYSKQRRVTRAGSLVAPGTSILLGTLNGSRLSSQFRMDAKIDKDFVLKWGKREEGKRKAALNVYFQILNVLNTVNIINVYRATGNPDDDGYLDEPEFQPLISTANSEESLRDLYGIKINNPGNYSLPRRIRLGLLLNF